MTKNRSLLKKYFKKGAIPTESDFGDLIDSMINQKDDNISKEPNKPLKITATGEDEVLLDFCRMENENEKLTWRVKQKQNGKPGLGISDAATNRLFIESGDQGKVVVNGPLQVSGTAVSSFAGNVGIGTTNPQARLQVTGGAIMPSAGGDESSGILFPRDPGGGRWRPRLDALLFAQRRGNDPGNRHSKRPQ